MSSRAKMFEGSLVARMSVEPARSRSVHATRNDLGTLPTPEHERHVTAGDRFPEPLLDQHAIILALRAGLRRPALTSRSSALGGSLARATLSMMSLSSAVPGLCCLRRTIHVLGWRRSTIPKADSRSSQTLRAAACSIRGAHQDGPAVVGLRPGYDLRFRAYSRRRNVLGRCGACHRRLPGLCRARHSRGRLASSSSSRPVGPSGPSACPGPTPNGARASSLFDFV